MTVAAGNESELAYVKRLRVAGSACACGAGAWRLTRPTMPPRCASWEDEAVHLYIPRKYRRSTLLPGFRYEAKADRVSCPVGAMGRPAPHPQAGFVSVFSRRTCQRCSLNAACLEDGRQRVYLHPGKDRDRPKGIRLAMRVRKVIERVFAETRKWHHLGVCATEAGWGWPSRP